jgi:hypothetical protein
MTTSIMTARRLMRTPRNRTVAEISVQSGIVGPEPGGETADSRNDSEFYRRAQVAETNVFLNSSAGSASSCKWIGFLTLVGLGRRRDGHDHELARRGVAPGCDTSDRHEHVCLRK